jgi:hypothetical protein
MYTPWRWTNINFTLFVYSFIITIIYQLNILWTKLIILDSSTYTYFQSLRATRVLGGRDHDDNF